MMRESGKDNISRVLGNFVRIFNNNEITPISSSINQRRRSNQPPQETYEFKGKYCDLFRNFNYYQNNDKKLKLLFYKYFIPLIIKNKLVDEKFIKDYKKCQKVINSFYA